MTEEEFNKLLEQIKKNEYKEDTVVINSQGADYFPEIEWMFVNDGNVKLLVETIKKNNYITKLDLSFNNISDVGVKILLELQQLQELNLYANKVSINGAMLLAQSNLLKLNLGCNPIITDVDEEQTEQLITAISLNKSLKSLNLDGCNLSDKMVSKLIKNNTTLEILDVSSNNLTDISLDTLHLNKTLNSLYLISNHITDLGIIKILDNKSIIDLNVSFNNEITEQSLDPIIASKLQTIGLYNNTISSNLYDQFHDFFEETRKKTEEIKLSGEHIDE